MACLGSQCIRVSRHKPDLSLYHVMMTIVLVFILTSLPRYPIVRLLTMNMFSMSRTSLAIYEVTTLNNIIKCQQYGCG